MVIVDNDVETVSNEDSIPRLPDNLVYLSMETLYKQVFRNCSTEGCDGKTYSPRQDRCARCRSAEFVGNRYGGIEIVRIGNQASLVARCDCGNEFQVLDRSQLEKGKLTSCGCRKHMNEIRKRSGIATTMTHVFTQAKKSAKDRGIEWLLTKEQWSEIVASECTYCGNPAGNETQGRSRGDGTRQETFYYNGVDRYDSNGPYSIDNSVPCCKTCNWMKRDLSAEEFVEHIKRIANYEQGN